jgi:hypothetical protein
MVIYQKSSIKCRISQFLGLIIADLYPQTMRRFRELEDLYERYNYKMMDQEELNALVKQLLTDREIFAQFFLYEVARDFLLDEDN